MAWQFWIDRGGTFTDLVGIAPDGAVVVRKVLSEQPEHRGDPAVRAIGEVLGLPEGAAIPAGCIDEVRLGTTVATNALLEAAGEPVLLVTNRGLGDLLQIGDQHRPDLFALAIRRPAGLTAGVVEVGGRLDARGREVEPLQLDGALEREIEQWRERGVNSCAIALMHAYAEPRHEQRLQTWLRERGFRTVVSSHEVCPLPRLVPRGQTCLAEAAVAPVLQRYLTQVRRALGPKPRLRVMGSSGSLLSPLRLLAKDTILSGPAGGMVGAVAAAQRAGLADGPLVGFDMGGTSTDVFHVAPGLREEDWPRIPETEVAGQRLMASRLPIHTVAAGGGSIIRSDGEQRLLVGPRSAGANPGPACYRRGGPLTITDANLLLGRLQLSRFPAVFGPDGTLPPDRQVVEARFAELAQCLGTSPVEVAEGALAIAVERMADAIRRVSLQRGHDIRGGSLVAFGGAGGQHACRLAEQLGLERVLLPPLAGVLSAWGIGHARQRRERQRAIRQALDDTLLTDLRRQAEAELAAGLAELRQSGDWSAGAAPGDGERRQRIELRYGSSEQGLLLPLPAAGDRDAVWMAFEEAHRQRFGYVPPRNDALVVERLVVELVAPVAVSGRGTESTGRSQEAPPSREAARVHWPGEGWRSVPLLQRQDLRPDHTVSGPALIVESTGCTVLEPGWQAQTDGNGALLLERCEQAPGPGSSAPAAAGARAEPMAARPDPVLLELFHHRFMAIAEQMGERLRQTSRSVNIRERLDFSCALFDHRGALVANAPHIPVHLGSMGEAVVDLLAQIESGERGPLGPGETVLSNDPFHGGTHLPDITAITPVHIDAGGPRFFVACRGHHADVGGLTPGSMPPFSRRIGDEGLLLRNVPFVVGGQHDRSLWERRLREGPMPPRNPGELLADLQAQVAANQLGVRELQQLVQRQGLEPVTTYMDHIQAQAAQAVRRVIEGLGSGRFSLELDNGTRLQLQLRVDRSRGEAVLDFSGTSPQGDHNFQAPLAVTKAAVLYVFRCLVREPIPLNAGCFQPLQLIVPEGCLLHPRPPAAVVAGNVETSQAVCNLLLGALGASAASQGTMNNLTFGDGRRQYYETIAGGSGAGSGFEGASGVQTHMTNSRLTDPEILEQRYPVRVERFGLRRGSGGRGRWRGGDGLVRRIHFLEPMTVAILSGSRRVAPFGLAGGEAGRVGRNRIERADGSSEELPGSAQVEAMAGDRLTIETPGGGGYGPAQPLRPPGGSSPGRP
ncbi:5-oxoprolinase [Synechococcus sp. RSCCF101]|uniref:hydantoinase B/oxoprolinase family protein n=1 Tax=Synechococcus sp. RSCCF101 TaxID=2511069 RepID=UPI0012474C6D|nr:hydantoinase B/oxoprolinase family protein [Synechococcus sp. RSCCF101]QEY32042.1 5-oxoprolinase [Synechococcus sp. RSCCF101]